MDTLEGKKDVSTVTSKGESKQKLIDGVVIRRAVTHLDERGTLTEIYNPAWDVLDSPLVYVYQATIHPGKVKGWVQHHLQWDRLFCSTGFMRIVLYDERPDSPTKGVVNQHYFSDQSRGIVTIPPYVWHAVQNVGTTEMVFVNLPTRPYDHENPDKFRLPLKNDKIPFSFSNSEHGW